MKLFIKHSLLFLCIALVGTNCKTTDPASFEAPEPKINNELTQLATEPDTSQSIELTINERVKYEFVKVDSSWTGVALQFDTNDPQTRKIAREIPLVPTYGWSDFEDVVQFLKIYTMPDQSEIDGHERAPLNPQSRAYKINVFEGENTRTYYYFNPEGELGDYWQSQNIVTFGTYLTNEMKVVQK